MLENQLIDFTRERENGGSFEYQLSQNRWLALMCDSECVRSRLFAYWWHLRRKILRRQHFLTHVSVSTRRVWWSTHLAYGSRRVTIIRLRTMNWWSSLNWIVTQKNALVAQDVSVIATDATSEQSASEWRKTFLFLGQCFICFWLPTHSFWVTFCCPTTDF